MTQEIVLAPDQNFLADIPKKDRQFLARQLETRQYKQGKKDVMYNPSTNSWSVLGAWEWCHGNLPKDLVGCDTPLMLELRDTENDFEAASSGGMYMETIAFARFKGFNFYKETPYCTYNRIYNAHQLMLEETNTPFSVFLSHEQDPHELWEYTFRLNFDKIASLLRGKQVTTTMKSVGVV